MDRRQKFIKSGLIVALLILSRFAVAELTSFTAIYKLQSLGITQATASNKLTINKTDYRYESRIQPVSWIGFINDTERYELSEGQIKNNQLIPEKYSYQHSEPFKDNRRVEVLFDYTNNKITNIHKHIDNKWKMKGVSQVQDRLSSQLSLMLNLQQSGIPSLKKDLIFSIADGGRLKQYSFNIIAEEKLETPLGTLNTIKLEHHRSTQEDIMILWCAEEFAYLPVKIIHKQSGYPDYISIIESYSKQ